SVFFFFPDIATLEFYSLSYTTLFRSNVRFNLSTSFVVSCQVPDRAVSAWTFSTMRLMLFRDGRYPRYAFPVLAEYIRPNVGPRKDRKSTRLNSSHVSSSYAVCSVKKK